jgi:hypothetical protein
LPTVQKEGDEFGIELIKERLEMDEKLMKLAISLYGIPKIFLRNAIQLKGLEILLMIMRLLQNIFLNGMKKKKKLSKKRNLGFSKTIKELNLLVCCLLQWLFP